MLSDFVFKTEMKNMAAAFGIAEGEKFEKRMAVYYDNLKKLGDQQFERAIHQIIKNNERFPSIADILTVAQGWSNYSEAQRIIECLPCDSTGIITAERDGQRYAFKCTLCNQSRSTIPEWDGDQLQRFGFVPKFANIDWDEKDEAQLQGLSLLDEFSLILQKLPPFMHEALKKFKEAKKENKNIWNVEQEVKRTLSTYGSGS